jgi:hypothetical protein
MPVSTLGDTIRWTDIEAACTQDPTTMQWTADFPTADIAGNLNADYRHFSDTRFSQLFRVLADELGLIIKDLGVGADPAADSFQWSGWFDATMRALPTTGQKNKVMRRAWNKTLTKGQDSEDTVPTVPPYNPRASQQDDKYQQGGLALSEWDEVCQVGVNDPGYDPLSDYYQNDQAVHDLWVTLTGGRRFGACSEASVDTAIIDQNAIEDRNLSFAGTQDVRGRAENAVAAANQSYQDGNNETQVIADGDAAYATPL